MAYICETLSTPDLTGHQTCSNWVAYQPSSGFLPTLTTADRDVLIIYFISAFVVVFTVQMLRKLFGI